MKNKNKAYLYILVALFIALVVAIIFIYRFFSPNQKGDLTSLFIEKPELVIDINLNQFTRTVVKEAFSQKGLPGLSPSQIQEKLNNREEDLQGFDNRSQLVIFQDSKEGKKIQGFLFHIKSLRKFNQFQAEDKKAIRKGNRKYGIIIYVEDRNDKELHAYYEKLAEEIITRKTEKRKQSTAIAKIQVRNKTSEILALELSLEKEKLIMSGTVRLSKNVKNKEDAIDSVSTLRPGNRPYLELNIVESPDTLNEVLNGLTQVWGLTLPAIKSQQLLVYSTKIDAVNKSLVILPEIDWILRFDQPFDIHKEMDTLDFPSYLLYDSLQGSVSVKGVSYYFKQLSENEIYIGNSIYPDYKKKIKTPNSWIKGRPEVLLSLEGESLIGNLLHASPQIRGAKSFFREVKSFEVNFFEINAEESEIKGEIVLERGKMMSIELLKALLY